MEIEGKRRGRDRGEREGEREGGREWKRDRHTHKAMDTHIERLKDT